MTATALISIPHRPEQTQQRVVTAQLPLFAISDRADAWSVRTSRRARRLSVRVYPGGRVEIVAPLGASPVVVQRFIGEHRQWIDERVRAFAGMVQVEASFPDRIELPAIGKGFSLDYVRQDAARVRLLSDSRALVAGPLEDRRAIALALRRWLCDVAMDELGPTLVRLSNELSLPFRRVQIRRQRTRWGSCSASGTISLNVCLLFLDPDVVRYLMVHELCHTEHMNHSRRFWDLVARHEPGFRALDRALLRGWQRVPWWMFG
jgi:predicted metal-dependent hydrolase